MGKSNHAKHKSKYLNRRRTDDDLTEQGVDWVAGGSSSDEGDEAGSARPSSRKTKQKKRKSASVDEVKVDAGSDEDELAEEPPSKKRRKGKKKRAQPFTVHEIALESAEEQARHLTGLVNGQLGDVVIEAKHFARAVGVKEHVPELLPEAIKEYVPDWKKSVCWGKGTATRPRGSPTVIIVCISARRCVQLLKSLSPFKTRVAKLFSKHMKLGQQAELLQSNVLTLAVGTPARLEQLAARGALSFDNTQCLVIDMLRNQKTLTVADSQDTQPDLAKLVRQVAPQVASGAMKLAYF